MADETFAPIASAPMDGTRIRLFHERSVDTYDGSPTGSYENGRWIMSHAFIVPVGRQAVLSFEPTHWAPLSEETVGGAHG